MCDTIVALGNATADGSVLFAKNSDREPNEAHELLLVPRLTHAEGSKVRCTYVEIPQAPETYAVLLAKPFWIWGAEMGANEHGVAIGNEALFTRVSYEKGPALTGMDLLRLGLERSASAFQALEVITHLLETYGQGGNCGFTHPFYYHNSFLIADPQEAWVLETAGRQWAAQKVQDVRSISNAITIEAEWDLASAGLVDYALERGWCKRREEFSFARCYSDAVYTRFSDARKRQCRTTDLARASQGRITPALMMAYLRDHGPAGQERLPEKGLFGTEVCMHAGFGPVRINQSVGSWVSHLTPQGHTHWATATSAPCTGIFKPLWIDALQTEGLPPVGLKPQGQYDPACLWWRHEVLHRAVLRAYAPRLALYREDRDGLEAAFLDEWSEVCAAPAGERAHFSAACFARADEATARWTEQVQQAAASAPFSWEPYLYRQAWAGFNRLANLPGSARGNSPNE